MARKYIADDSDDDLPDLDEIISKHMRTLPPPTALSKPLFSPAKTALKRDVKTRASPRKTTASATANEEIKNPSKQGPAVKELKLELPKPSLRAGKKVPLKPAQDYEDTVGVDKSEEDGSDTPPTSRSLARARATPRRGAKTGVNYAVLMDVEEDEEDIEESIWCGTESEGEEEKEQDQAEESEESEEEMPSRRRLFRSPRKTSSSGKPLDSASDLSNKLGRLDLRSDSSINEEGKKLRSPRKKLQNPSFTQEDDSTLPHDPSDKENSLPAILHFSPPRSRRPITLSPERPRPSTPTDRPSTPPPLSPSKSRLVSPSKKKPRIPTPPHRPSLDAFWHADEINTWNDTHSPSKPLQSPRKNQNRFLNSTSTSPTTSPRKQSPMKRTKAEIEARKAWGDGKHDLAAAFLEELDRTVTGGRIGEATEGTGGVRLLWSKTLTSTAGRANWKRETIRPASTSSSKPNTPPARDSVTSTSVTTPAAAPAPAPAAVYKHHASIELAEKVIDAPHRLLNTLAHEFCHLATFILDGQAKNPHGREFKTWGKKTSKLFAARGVEVTTKHSYQISYRYIWRCSGAIGDGDGDGDGGCGTEFKRHSRSIDPTRHACGNCRGRLVQVKPVPRKGAGAAKGAGVGGYALFVKENFAAVRRGLGEGGGRVEQKRVMEELGRLYRVQKEKGLVEGGTVTPTGEVEVEMEGEVEGVTKAMEMVVLGE